MSDILPPIAVDHEIDDEGGRYEEETLEIGSSPSSAREVIAGEEDFSTIDLTSPATLGEGVSIDLGAEGLTITKTIYDNRQRARCINVNMSFNAEDSERFMSLVDNTLYDSKEFQDKSFNDILRRLSDATAAYPQARIVYSGDHPKLNSYAGPITLENIDIVSAFTQVLERAGRFSWWLKRNAGPPGPRAFSDEVEILDLDNPQAIDVAQFKVNIPESNVSGSDVCPITGVIVTDKDGRGSKQQYGVPGDYGRDARPGAPFGSEDPIESSSLTRANIINDEEIIFENYDISSSEFGQGRQNLWTIPPSADGSYALIEDMKLSVNPINGKQPIFDVSDTGRWVNAEPQPSDLRHAHDFIKIERKLLTHPGVDITIEAFHAPQPTLVASETFHERTVTSESGTRTVISAESQYQDWVLSKPIKSITERIDQGKDVQNRSYTFKVFDYTNNDGRAAKRVGLILLPEAQWTSIPEIKVDFDRGYIFIPNKYFYILGDWASVSEFIWVTDPSIATGASSTTPKLTISASFEEALLASRIRMIGVLSRPHKVARSGSAPFSIIKKGDYESANVAFNAAGTEGYKKFTEPFNDYSAMVEYANTLLSNNIIKSGAQGSLTIYPGNQSVFPGRSTNGGTIVRVHHKYIPYFVTDINFAGNEGAYDLENLEIRRVLNETKELVELNDESIRKILGGVSTTFGGGGSQSLVPPHTHSDQFSGGTNLGHLTVKSLTIEGEATRGADDKGAAINVTAYGETGTIDLKFDPDKGKFVSSQSIFVEKVPATKRKEGVVANESTAFIDPNDSNPDSSGELRARSGYAHNVFDFTKVGQGSTDDTSRLALNVVPQKFEPFDSTYGESSDILRNWGGDRVYIGDANSRPGFLGAYASNQILLYSKLNENDNSRDFIGNNFLNETPASILGVRKGDGASTYLDSLFNRDAEIVGYAGMFMDKDHDYQTAFKIDTLSSSLKGTELEFAFPSKSGFWFGTHFSNQYDNLNDFLSYSRLVGGSGSPAFGGTGTVEPVAHVYQFANKSETESGFGVRLGSNTGTTKAIDYYGGSNANESVAFDVYNIKAASYDLSYIRGIATSKSVGGSEVFFSSFDKESDGLSSIGDTYGKSSALTYLRGGRYLAACGVNGIYDIVADLEGLLNSTNDYFDSTGTFLKRNDLTAAYPFKVNADNLSKGSAIGLWYDTFEITLEQPRTGYSSDQRPRMYFDDTGLYFENGKSNSGRFEAQSHIRGEPFLLTNYGFGSEKIVLLNTILSNSGLDLTPLSVGGILPQSYVPGNGTPGGDEFNTTYSISYDSRGLIRQYFFSGSPISETQFDQLLESFDGLVDDFDSLRAEVYNQFSGWGNGFPGGGSGSGGGISMTDFVSILSFVIDSIFGAIEDLAQAIDDLGFIVDALRDKLKKVQEELAKLRTSMKKVVLRISINLSNKRRKEGTGTGPPPGGTTPGPTNGGGTTPGDGGGTSGSDVESTGEVPGESAGEYPLDLLRGSEGSTQPQKDDDWAEQIAESIFGGTGDESIHTPVGPIKVPGFGSAVGEAGYIKPLGTGTGVWAPEDAGGGLEPGGGEEGELKDNKSSLTGFSVGIEAATGNATRSAGSSAANRRVTQYKGLNDYFNASEIQPAPLLEPENSIYDSYKNTGRLPMGMQFNPSSNPDIYLLNAPGIEIGTALRLWSIGGGGGSPAASTGVSSDSLAPQGNPTGIGWDRTQDVRSILQLANRTPTTELDAIGRWIIVGGGHIFPTMLDGSGQIRISDDTSARVNIGGLSGFSIGSIKDIAGFEVRPELIVSPKAFGSVATDSAGDKYIVNNYGVFKAELDTDGKYIYLDNSSVPIYGGLIGTIRNQIDRYNSLLPSTNTGLFTGGSLTNITANSSIEEAVLALDSAVNKNKFDATTDPTTTDDSADGYTVGSTWVNVSANTVFTCVDNTLSAAVWVEVSGGGSGGGSPWDFDGGDATTVHATGTIDLDGGDST